MVQYCMFLMGGRRRGQPAVHMMQRFRRIAQLAPKLSAYLAPGGGGSGWVVRGRS